MEWTPEVIAKIRVWTAEGKQIRWIMGELGVGKAALRGAMNRHGIAQVNGVTSQAMRQRGNRTSWGLAAQDYHGDA